MPSRSRLASRFCCLKALLAVVCAVAPPVSADIYEWEYIDPQQPELGKRESTTIVPDGAGVDAVPYALLRDRNLRKAYFIGADLTGANLVKSSFTGADFTDAIIVDASMVDVTSRGFTFGQFASTASYKTGNVYSISLSFNDMSGWDFSYQMLADAAFNNSDLDTADFTGADLTGSRFYGSSMTGTLFDNASISGASFSNTTDFGFTYQQFTSTASYQSGDLPGLDMRGNDLTGWDLSGANLDRVRFGGSTLTSMDLAGSSVWAVDFSDTTSRGFTYAQLISTATYQAGDLSYINLSDNDLAGWDMSGINLTGANLHSVSTGMDLTDSLIRDAKLPSDLTAAQLYSTTSYQLKVLGQIDLREAAADGWDLSGQDLNGANLPNGSYNGVDLSHADLRRASFYRSDLSGADISDADIRGAYFRDSGITLTQVMSTTSYQEKDLRGTQFYSVDLSGADFSGQNLIGVRYDGSTYNMNLDGADLRYSNIYTDWWSNEYTNLIDKDGTVRGGISLGAGDRFAVRDFGTRDSGVPPISVTVLDAFSLSGTSTITFVLFDTTWQSTIHFDPSVGTAYFGGTLELSMKLDDGLTPGDLLGASFKLFDWTGVTVDGWFEDVVLDPAWYEAGLGFDLGQLQASGIVRVVPLIGDLDGDGFVGIADLNIVLASWNQAVTSGSLVAGDISGDGFVGIEDLTAVLGTWNAAVSPPAGVLVPEPGGLAVLGLAGLGLARRRAG